MQSMNTRLEFTDIGIRSRGFNVAERVADHVDSINAKKKKIAMLEANQVKLERYIASKPLEMQKYIVAYHIDGNSPINEEYEEILDEEAEDIFKAEQVAKRYDRYNLKGGDADNKKK